MATYTARAVRSGGSWAVHVPEVGRWTQARHLREVDEMARDLIAIMEDVDPETVEVKVEVEPPKGVASRLERARKLRDEEARAKRQANEEMRTAAKELQETGMPLRDVGQVLGVTYQRAHQLVSEAKELADA